VIEITVRDGRASRDWAQDTAEGGAVLADLQRDQPYEIGDVIMLPDGLSLAVIGDREQILPGDTWKQTVFVGELSKPKPKVTINLGSCPEWTLQNAKTTTFVRCVAADEAEQIKTAAAFCRKYATMPTHRLLNSSFMVWKQTFERVANAKKGELQLAATEELLGAFVGWILVWRLVLDQAAHDLSSRFGSDSDQVNKFRTARKRAYDGSRAYRVVEALRNLVQHSEMPYLVLNRTEELDRATGRTIANVSYKLPASYFLNSSKCSATVKNEFRSQPELELELPEIIDQAMTAINTVLLEFIKTSMPELAGHINQLRKISIEASGMPLLLRLKPLLAGSKLIETNLEMVPLHDLQFLVRNAPIPDATVQDDETG
jgi:hypothetical protein